MNHLALQTEYSFRQCYGPIDKVVQTVAEQGCSAAGIADINNTFGHVEWAEACSKYGIKPIFGVRLCIVEDKESAPRYPSVYSVFLANNIEGLECIYELTSKAWDNFHYSPRLYWSDLKSTDSKALGATLILNPTGYLTGARSLARAQENWPGAAFLGYPYPDSRRPDDIGAFVPILRNWYPTILDKDSYQVIAGTTKRGDTYITKFESQTYPQHILTQAELKHYFGEVPKIIVDLICDKTENIKLNKAPMAKFPADNPEMLLIEKCRDRMHELGFAGNLDYEERYAYELNLIKQKDYIDYFMIVSDMINMAGKTMLVGPARGSSAGSLICYLLNITKVDPIKHNLLFERFIDINRFDLPDIDCDFPDKKRNDVIDYLSKKYGKDRVRALANINTFKPKSAIGEVAQALGIPKYETEDVKGAIIERSGGDARAAMCIADTFDSTEAGGEFISKYPKMRLTQFIEGHASHSGKHAAGIIVSTDNLTRFGAIDSRNQIIMLDKGQAEKLGLLKIDCLGLRTLSIIEETLDAIGMPYEAIYSLELDDEDTFKLFNDMRLNGIFQFEGYALQSLTRQMGCHEFNDIAAITALARPGALNSGGAARYVKYKTGKESPRYYNDIHREITEETFGICVYQEQMMEIARKIGQLSWEDVSTLRKAASKSMGDEFFSKYKDIFLKGASTTLSEEDANALWNDISHSGSWSFNKSHAVSYGLISYWTAYLKANYPLEFSMASLNNASDDSHAIKLLRDMVIHDGIKYVPVDADISDINWSVHDGILYGGLTNIPGVGVKKAQDIKNGKIGSAMFAKLMDPKTPFDVLFPARHYFNSFYVDPKSYGLDKPAVEIKDIQDEGDYIFLGRLVDRNVRDLNEYVFLRERAGERIEEDNLYLLFTLEDDTDSIICKIPTWAYEEIGREIAERGKVGDSWYLVKGTIKGQWRKIHVEQIVNIEGYKANA